MQVQEATNQEQWDTFLSHQRFRPFLQSWTMGEVYKAVKQEPLRLEVRENNQIAGICQAIVTPARRGRHLSVPYGPIVSTPQALEPLIEELKEKAKAENCTFIRMSPFWKKEETVPGTKLSPLHLLAEHLWYIPLTVPNSWEQDSKNSQRRGEEEILMSMRKTTRNLVRRAEREGVEIVASDNPLRDLSHFFTLYDETRIRHKFVPYTNAFITAQVQHFSERNECTLYLAKYNNAVIASSIHMHAFGETSYHHGASSQSHSKIPASYLLQWTAIRDALKRGDSIYNFWGVSPEGVKNHPFAGVRTFKTGFSGEMLELTHCMDVPLNARYYLTRSFEIVRKLHRGF